MFELIRKLDGISNAAKQKFDPNMRPKKSVTIIEVENFHVVKQFIRLALFGCEVVITNTVPH